MRSQYPVISSHAGFPFRQNTDYALIRFPLRIVIRVSSGKLNRAKYGEKTWESGWFRITAAIPTEWEDGNFALHLDFNGEALVFDSEGIPLYGLTNGSVFDRHYSKECLPAAGGMPARRYRRNMGRNGGESPLRC